MGERRRSSTGVRAEPMASSPGPHERTPLLPSFENRLWSFKSSSSSESSLTISSLDSSESSAFVPWWLAQSNDLEAPTPASDIPEYQYLEDDDDEDLKKDNATPENPIKKVIAILILGMFTANADGSLVLATHSTIASEFNNLEASSWLMTSFALAGASFQSIVCCDGPVHLTRVRNNAACGEANRITRY